MPNRIIKESICTSETIDQLSWFEEVLFTRLIVNCDDYGRFDGRTAVIKSRLFPLKDITAKTIEQSINKLATVGLVTLYRFEGKPYLQLPTWEKHQTIRAKKSKYPPFDTDIQQSENICMQMQADESECPRNPIQSESNPNPNTNPNTNPKESVRASRFTRPSVEEVAEYCRERGNSVDAEHFVDYYNANGWKVGKNPMKDWRAAVRNWEKRDADKSAKQESGGNIFADILREEYGYDS